MAEECKHTMEQSEKWIVSGDNCPLCLESSNASLRQEIERITALNNSQGGDLNIERIKNASLSLACGEMRAALEDIRQKSVNHIASHLASLALSHSHPRPEAVRKVIDKARRLCEFAGWFNSQPGKVERDLVEALLALDSATGKEGR